MRIRVLLPGLLLAGVLAGCGVLGRSAPSTAATGPWTPVATAPIELTEVAVAVHHGRIWVAGGLRPDGTASVAVLVFDPVTDKWSTGPTLPAAVHHAALVSTSNGLVLVGGYVGDTLTIPTNAVRRLDDGATTWLDGVPLPEARAAGGATFDGTRIVYAGGVKPDGVAGEVFAFSPGEGAWTPIGRLPTAREHLAVTTDGAGRTFVLGGRVGGVDKNLGIVDVVQGTGDDAVHTMGELPTKRGGVGAFWWPSLGACLAGGESPGGTNPQVECIGPDGALAVLPDLVVARHGVGAAVIDGAAYVVLGGRQPGLFASDVTEKITLP
jgi:hypothetical protein